ncbi:MAG: hypothetical protein Marn2KO_09900 [Marinobacter nauticus]
MPLYVNNLDSINPSGEVVSMNAPLKQSRADVLNRLYDMKRKQLAQASQQGNSLRCQVLEAEAEAISNALKTVR